MRCNWMAHHQEKLIQYEPLASKDYKERGFEFAGDPIIVDAMARWAKKPVGEYEDFLRRAYWREAVLQDALVVDLGSGDPLLESEVMQADPYCLAVMYEDGSFSKIWEEAPREVVQKITNPSKERKAAPRETTTIQPSPENMISATRFHGSACRNCKQTLRYVKGRTCVVCDKASADAWALKQRMQQRANAV